MTFRRTTCPQCSAKLEPGQRIHPACISAYADAQAAKAQRTAAKQVRAERKAERKEDKARRDKLKSKAEWAREAQTAVNRYVRLKAQANGEGCYTCGATPAQKFGGTFDASHFRSVGSAPHLRFWIPQIRICCIVCNRHKGGELLAFRRALVAEHGAQWVEELEARQETAKFSIDYLSRLKKIITKRTKRLEKLTEGIVQ